MYNGPFYRPQCMFLITEGFVRYGKASFLIMSVFKGTAYCNWKLSLAKVHSSMDVMLETRVVLSIHALAKVYKPQGKPGSKSSWHTSSHGAGSSLLISGTSCRQSKTQSPSVNLQMVRRLCSDPRTGLATMHHQRLDLGDSSTTFCGHNQREAYINVWLQEDCSSSVS